MSQNETGEEEYLTGEDGGPIDDEGGDAAGSEHNSESEDEEGEPNAGEQWFRSLARRVLQRPEVSLVQLMHKIAVAKERADAYTEANKRYRAQCAAGALTGKQKTRGLVTLLQTQVEMRTHQAEAMSAQNRVYAARCEGLE